MAGKGDTRRPAAIAQVEMQANWDAIFGPRKKRASGRTLGRSYEKACEHGVGHPYPGAPHGGVHGCDGCCSKDGFYDD